ncbi:MAG: hypothetical protein HY396_02100 [Candidatus Doudnabacteria bacterium]|nr:hypothetical protein [Candidatus Doudnabacteria bacterium]
MAHIVKRKGHKEKFDARKVYASVYAACRNAHLSEIQSEKIADSVTKTVEKWIADKAEVSSQQIFEEITKILRHLEPDTAFLYETHRDIV